MAYDHNSWMNDSERGQAQHNQSYARAFNGQWDGPMHQAPLAFPDSYGQQQTGLNLDTHLPNTYDQQSDAATTPTPYAPEAIRNWTDNEEPWSGIPLTAPRIDTSVGQTSQHRNPFAVPRSPARSTSTASAMGPPHIDSAYCSNASPIANEPTTAGSDCQEVTGMFGRMPYPFAHSAETPSTPGRPAQRRTASVAGSIDEMNIPDDGKCTFCKRDFRLKSELKKHMLRHTRPYRCKIPTCNGHAEGFTTSNDLDRHNRSVHSIFPKGAKVYVCAAKNCAEGEKTWPRYDNFKQHCERMHKHEGLESLIRKSERQAPPPSSEVQQHLNEYSKKPGAGRKRSAISDTASMPPGPSSRAAPGYSSLQESAESAFYDDYKPYPYSDTASWSGYQGAVSDFSSSDPSARVAQRQINRMRGHRMSDAASLSSSRMSSSRVGGRTPQIVLHQAGDGSKQQQQRQTQQNQQLAHMQFEHAPTESPIEYFQDTSGLQQQHHPRTQSESQLLTPQMARSRSLSSQSSVSTAAKSGRGRAATYSGSDRSRSAAGKRKQEGAASNPKRVRCKWPGCGKADMRPCELKKHERRHSRPFGCTFDFCHKAFGSKNDWKRHEASQHFHDEMWRCSQPYVPYHTSSPSPNPVFTLSQSDCETSSPCALVFYEKADLAAHLASQHQADPTAIDALCEQGKIGRNMCTTFWCGFCKAICTLENEGRKGWDERFDHIGAHFHPEGRNIKDWVPPIGNKSKGTLLDEKVRQNEGSSDSKSDMDAAGDADTTSFVTASSIDGADVAAFPSPGEGFENSMTGIEFAGMGAADLNLNLDTSFTGSFTSAPDSSAATAFPAMHNGQLPSPAASGSQEACSRRQRLGSPDPKFCCQCGDGPMNARLRQGVPCLTCGHSCEVRCES